MHRTTAAITTKLRNRHCLSAVYEAICLDATEMLAATRASVWLFSADVRTIHCQRLFDTRIGRFVDGGFLSADDYAPYFDAIRADSVVAANDMALHPATACFMAGYAQPNGLRALLDVIVPDGTGTPTGILCCEQADAPRDWTERDVIALHGLARSLALTYKYRGRIAA